MFWHRLTAFGAALTIAGTAHGAQKLLDPATPADALEISKRVQCGEADGNPAVYHWSGKIYSRVEGEPDRLLFLGEGMNIRTCVSVSDPQRGTGWRSQQTGSSRRLSQPRSLHQVRPSGRTS